MAVHLAPTPFDWLGGCLSLALPWGLHLPGPSSCFAKHLCVVRRTSRHLLSYPAADLPALRLLLSQAVPFPGHCMLPCQAAPHSYAHGAAHAGTAHGCWCPVSRRWAGSAPGAGPLQGCRGDLGCPLAAAPLPAPPATSPSLQGAAGAGGTALAPVVTGACTARLPALEALALVEPPRAPLGGAARGGGGAFGGPEGLAGPARGSPGRCCGRWGRSLGSCSGALWGCGLSP